MFLTTFLVHILFHMQAFCGTEIFYHVHSGDHEQLLLSLAFSSVMILRQAGKVSLFKLFLWNGFFQITNVRNSYKLLLACVHIAMVIMGF